MLLVLYFGSHMFSQIIEKIWLLVHTNVHSYHPSSPGLRFKACTSLSSWLRIVFTCDKGMAQMCKISMKSPLWDQKNTFSVLSAKWRKHMWLYANLCLPHRPHIPSLDETNHLAVLKDAICRCLKTMPLVKRCKSPFCLVQNPLFFVRSTVYIFVG